MPAHPRLAIEPSPTPLASGDTFPRRDSVGFMASPYAELLEKAVQWLPCDAAALLQLDEDSLRPVAVHGLAEEALQRRFPLAGHPRLATLMRSDGFHRFEADCGLPDPYDGLIEAAGATTPNELLPVHDCMGAPILVAGRPWGVVTFDALHAGAFDGLDATRLSDMLALLSGGVAAASAQALTAERTARSARVTRAALPFPASAAHGRRRLEGRSAALQQLIREVDTVAPSDLTVLILGETGVGKELVAQRLHEGSRRAQHPFVQLNCAALPETLADSELFGHRRGAFTGAVQDRTGKFELATGGTLMLDEVGELPLAVQAKLLRTLQSGDIQRPGSDRPLKVDVRVVAATNRDLRAEVAAGRFRADLYHRLAVYPVHVPPLRARGSDVLALAGHFLEDNQHRLGAHNLRLSPAAREALLRHDWPGNVRELEHLISRAALRAWAQQRKTQRWVTIGTEHLGLTLPAQRGRLPEAPALALGATPSGQAAFGPSSVGPAPFDGASGAHWDDPHLLAHGPDTLLSLRAATERFQRQWLAALLERHPASMAAAAREAGMDRSNFHRLIRKLGLVPDHR